MLVTSGPTRAYIDHVRYIANASTGALGARIVEALTARNIPVVHLYGAGSEKPSVGAIHESPQLLESIPVTTVDDLIQAVEAAAQRGDIAAVIHAMAVLDYVPEAMIEGKMPSGEDHWDIRLVRTPKVIGLLRELMPDSCIVGFKLESGISDRELVARAAALMDKYRLDLVVANRLENIDANKSPDLPQRLEDAKKKNNKINLRAFAPSRQSKDLADRHEALFVGPGGQVLARFSSKRDIAASLADFIIERGFSRI